MSKILVIEDESSLAFLLVRKLSSLGHKVVVAADAYQGLSLARKEEPDLIILDWMLPAGGGLSVLERIKAIPNAATIPIIVATALQNEGLDEKILAAGADAFIGKPYDFDKMNKLIQDLTEKVGSN
jgi:DNA-binding response OmpR family regulator